MYFRVKSLHELGIKITLHCFDYGRGRPKQLEEICEQVFYYPRKSALQCLFSIEPYIVHSRRNKELFDRIFADDSPVLLEGTHTCACLTDVRHKKKKTYVRMHNIEEDYYRHLADAAHFGFTKWYYYFEARRLKRFEHLLSEAACLFSVSEKDHAELSARFKKVEFLPPFIYNDRVECKAGKGNYALYQGNLLVEENLKAARFLVEKVFIGLPLKLIVAGKGAGDLGAKYGKSNIEFVNSPSGNELMDFINNAHINVLPTFQPTGIKHKLINALFAGRFCVVNSTMIEGIGVDGLCVVADGAQEMKARILELFQKEFSADEIVKRKNLLEARYSHKRNAEHLVKTIFG